MTTKNIPVGFFVLDVLGVLLLAAGIFGYTGSAEEMGLPWLPERSVAVALIFIGIGVIAVAGLHLVTSLRFQQSMQRKDQD